MHKLQIGGRHPDWYTSRRSPEQMLPEDEQTRFHDLPVHLVEVTGIRPVDPWAQHNLPPVCRGVRGTYRQGLHQVGISIAVVSGERYAVHRIPLRLRCTKHQTQGHGGRRGHGCGAPSTATFMSFSVRNANSNGPTFKVISAPSRFKQPHLLQRLFTHLP